MPWRGRRNPFGHSGPCVKLVLAALRQVQDAEGRALAALEDKAGAKRLEELRKALLSKDKKMRELREALVKLKKVTEELFYH